MGALLDSFLQNQQPKNTSVGTTPATGGILLQSFLQNAERIKNTPKPTVSVKKVSTAPIAQPKPATSGFLDQTQKAIGSATKGIGEFATAVEKKIQGLFTPTGQTKPFEITIPTKKITTPVLTPDQQKLIGKLEVGQKIPGFVSSESQPSARLKQSVIEDNLIDKLFTKTSKSAVNIAGIVGNSIKKPAQEIYTDPTNFLDPIFDGLEFINPKIRQQVKDNPAYKIGLSSIQGVVQGALRVYANWNPKVESFLDKEVVATGKKGDAEIVGNTVGNIVGTIGGFVLGGEIVQALKFGKFALPATFAALGQTSLPANTPVEARARNLIIDTATGTVLEYIKPLTNLKNLGVVEKSLEYSKQLSKSMAAMSTQIYLDARSVGAEHEQALEMVKNSALIMLGIHGFMIAGKAGKYAVSSKFKEGSAVFTPDQARGIVVGSNLENTQLGKTIMKWSFDAEAAGKSLKIDMGAAKKSPIAGALNLKTPNGIRINKIELVDQTVAPKLGETSKEVVPVGKPVQSEKTTIIPGESKVKDYTSAKDFATEVYSADPKNQIGIVDPNTIIVRDPVGKGAEYDALKADIQTNGIKEPIRVTVEGGAVITTDGSQRTAIAQELGIDVPVIVNSGKIPGLKTIQEIYDGQTIEKPLNAKNREINEKNTEQVVTDTLAGNREDMRLSSEENIKIAKKYESNGLPSDATPDTLVTVYRAGTDVGTKPGDHVTLDKENAGRYLSQRQDSRIMTAQVPLRDLVFSGGLKSEFIFAPTHTVVAEAKKEEPVSFVLSPSETSTPEEAFAEAEKLGLPPEVIKETFNTGSSGKHISGYRRPVIGKAEFKTIVDNSPEFKANPVLTVDENKHLVFDSKQIHFTITPEQMQINMRALTPGDTVKVDIKSLKGKVQQMRVKDSSGNVLGFNPKNLENPFSKEATETLDEIVKQSDIAKRLSDMLGVPIRRGKFRHGAAIGIYKPGQKVIRIKKGGLNTIFHEVAHYLDDTIGFSNSINVVERKNLMQEYGHSYEGQPHKQKKEAFAEYMRFRMTGQTEKIDQWAPEFDKVFSEKIKTMPDIESVINTASDDFTRWNSQPATAKVLSHLSIGGQDKPGIKARVTQTLHDLYTSGLDDLHPLSEFSKLANKKFGKLDATQDPYVLARNLRGWVGKADLFLNKGTFGKEFWNTENGKTKMNFTGKSYTEIMKPVEEMNALNDFRVYIVAQRIVNDLAPREIVSGISLADAQKALDELNEKYPEFEQIAAQRREYKDQLLEYAKDNGVVGEVGLARIKELNKYHVPFYRVMEESNARFLGKTKIGGNLGNPIKKIKGSEREIIDPLESDVKDTYAIINAAERNNIGIAMANIAKGNFELGRLFEEVAKPLKPVTVNVKEVMDKAVKGTDAEGVEFPEELADAVVTLFRTTHATGANMLNVNMGDTQKVFEVDPDLFKAIQGLEIEDVGIIMKILSVPAKVLRAGATLTPDFSVRNPLRDQFTAFVYSKYGFVPGVDLVRGMWELFRKGDTYNLWKAGGGEHAMFVSLDRVKVQKNLAELIENKGIKDSIIDLAKNPLAPLQILSELGEAGTRLGEMRNALARGANPIEAAYASRNITLDFSRIGSKTRAINAIVAFFNASIQGTDTMVRNFKERPFRSLWNTFLGITLPSILLYLANRDDPRWKEIPQWQKNIFWIILTPDHIYRIPKPFELGVIFGSVPERILETMDTKDPSTINELQNTIMNGFMPGIMPTAIIPIIENITNYSFFMDRPIVSRGKEGLPPGEQSGTYTTEVSKLLGSALNYSPAKIDNLVAGYTGGLGKYAQVGLDKILIGTGIVVAPPKPESKFEDTPVLKAFMVREPIGTGSESVNKVYNMYSTTNAQLTYVKSLVKDGKGEEATTYIKKHPDTVDAIVLNGAVTTFSQMNKAIDMIRESKELTPAQKTEKIDQVQRLQTQIAKKTLDQIRKRKK